MTRTGRNIDQPQVVVDAVIERVERARTPQAGNWPDEVGLSKGMR
jgi:hypothetical protein